MTDINLGEGTNSFCGSTALSAGIGGFIGSWFGNGGFGWGNRGYGYGPGVGTVGVMAQNGFDTSMLHDDNMAIANQLENIGARQTDANYRVNMNLSNGISSAYTGLTNTLNANNVANMQGQYATQAAINSVGTTLGQDLAVINSNISNQGYESRLATKDLGTQMGQCCCSIKSAVLEDGAKTREMIQQNYISGLQGMLADAKCKANQLESQLAFNNSQTAQTQYLLEQLKTTTTA